jgi:hypothetical protein
VTVAPDKHVLFAYSKRHDGAAVDELLDGYSGYLVADAHAVYDHLYRNGAVIEVGCWAHARRYFFKALESDPERAKTALAWIGVLFALERSMTSTPAKKRREIRQARAAPIVDAFFAWCDQEAGRVLDLSPMAQGIGYARNQRVALRRFLDDGRLPMHNNISELNLRREVVGRKNWLFVGSDDGGDVNATIVSVLASCSLHKIEPFAYMRDLLCLLPRWAPVPASSSSLPPTGARPSRNARLRRPSRRTSSVASSSASMAVPRIAHQNYPVRLPPSATGRTERLRSFTRSLSRSNGP